MTSYRFLELITKKNFELFVQSRSKSWELMDRYGPFFVEDLSNDLMFNSTLASCLPQFYFLPTIIFEHSVFLSDFFLKDLFPLATLFSISFDVFTIQ